MQFYQPKEVQEVDQQAMVAMAQIDTKDWMHEAGAGGTGTRARQYCSDSTVQSLHLWSVLYWHNIEPL